MAGRRRPAARRLNWKKFVLFCGSVLLLVVLAIGAGLYAFLGGLGPSVNEAAGRGHPEPARQEPINVLVLGLDAGVLEPHTGYLPERTDTIMVVTFDPEKKRAGILSIPRDTRVSIPGHGLDKINAAHAYGGTDLAIKTVENLLNIPIHYYVKINYAGLTKLVDALGGVKIDVEQNMHYVDRAGGLKIDLKAGPQVLDGAKAEQYLRYRNQTGDLGRIGRQQKFVRALAEQVFSASTLLKIPELARIVSENVETDMSPAQIVYYANLARQVDLAQVPIETLEGTPKYIGGVSYFLVDQGKIGDQVAKVLLGVDREANKAVRLEVLNGSGEPGAAREVAEQLSNMG
ncbi:MAG: polyisoprenyl-teichoic acid--peptidoglycan teichoic acid transferase, partial [Bacillota bacterium]|nr:polyisoprenyl-teichoic acid--peptidoglycan teichoic acid transferase [Bacillota bacterium]